MSSELNPRGSYVVDASVLVKLFLPEQDEEVAAALMRRPLDEAAAERVVLDLTYLECANVFWKRVRKGELALDAAMEIMDDLLGLPLDVWPSSAVGRDALRIAVDLGISAYDAAYVALSEQLTLPLITSDEALARKAQGNGKVILLSNL